MSTAPVTYATIDTPASVLIRADAINKLNQVVVPVKAIDRAKVRMGMLSGGGTQGGGISTEKPYLPLMYPLPDGSYGQLRPYLEHVECRGFYPSSAVANSWGTGISFLDDDEYKAMQLLVTRIQELALDSADQAVTLPVAVEIKRQVMKDIGFADFFSPRREKKDKAGVLYPPSVFVNVQGRDDGTTKIGGLIKTWDGVTVEEVVNPKTGEKIKMPVYKEAPLTSVMGARKGAGGGTLLQGACSLLLKGVRVDALSKDNPPRITCDLDASMWHKAATGARSASQLPVPMAQASALPEADSKGTSSSSSSSSVGGDTNGVLGKHGRSADTELAPFAKNKVARHAPDAADGAGGNGGSSGSTTS